MANHDPKSTGLFASLAKLGRSIVDLVRVVEEEATRLDTLDAEPAPAPLTLPAGEPNSEAAQLLTQHTPGWTVPHPSRLPVPTYSPAMTAFGIVFIALGAVTVWPLSVVGAAIFVAGIAKWIGELLHD
jgi:hypothetical protein